MAETLAYPPRVPFQQLMAVKQTERDTFESIQLAWPPGIVPTRTFGGHVFAQAAYSASKTVKSGMIIHNCTGHFLLPGRSDVPFQYRVRRIRDGGVYCLRSVDVYQHVAEGASAKDPWRVVRDADTPCFHAVVSFKREERSSSKAIDFAHQDAPPDHVKTQYSSVLDGLAIPQHPRGPSADAQWYLDSLGSDAVKHSETFPGVEIRKVDMKAFNDQINARDGQNAAGWRQLCFYRIIPYKTTPQSDDSVVLPDAETDALNLDACAHIYASDRNSLFLIQRALGFEKRQASAGSLAHTVIFHGSPRNLPTIGKDGEPKWWVQEAWTSNSGESRGCHESRLWDYDEGKIIATTVQDGMMRVPTADHSVYSKESSPKRERKL